MIKINQWGCISSTAPLKHQLHKDQRSEENASQKTKRNLLETFNIEKNMRIPLIKIIRKIASKKAWQNWKLS